MPGRLRTASRPSRTWIAEASYVPCRCSLVRRAGHRVTSGSSFGHVDLLLSAGGGGLQQGRCSSRKRPEVHEQARNQGCGSRMCAPPAWGRTWRPKVHRDSALGGAACGPLSRCPVSGPLRARRLSAIGRSAPSGGPRGLSRRCRAGPRPSRTERRPFFQRRQRADRAPSIRVTVPSPSSSLSRRTTVGASSRSWVAQAVESVRTTMARRRRRTPGVAVRRDLRADELGPPAEDAVHPQVGVPAALGDQPARASRRAAAGHGRPGRAPEPAPGGVARRRPDVRAPGPGRRPVPRRWPGTGDRLGQVEPVVRRGTSAGRSRGSVRAAARRQPSSAFTHDAPRRRRRTAPRPERAGHVGGHGRGDQHLLGAGDEVGEPFPAVGVELGEHVVEDQDRVVALGAQQVVRRQPQRERVRPGLAVAGVAAWPAAGRPRVSTSSSRCGPTRDMPRSSSSAPAREQRARPGPPSRSAGSSGQVEGGLGSRSRRRSRDAPRATVVVGLVDAGAQRVDERRGGRPAARRRRGRGGRPRRRGWPGPTPRRGRRAGAGPAVFSSALRCRRTRS